MYKFWGSEVIHPHTVRVYCAILLSISYLLLTVIILLLFAS